jgi:signal transduction histidine kinase
MNKPEKITNKSDKLREAAEKLISKKKKGTEAALSETDNLKLIHELEVHQLELEMQNEELKQAREKAELAEKKYTELYDFAPAGYLTLTKEGEISELNFSAALLLGKERSYLIEKRFALFVSADTRAEFNTFIQNIYQTKSKGSCEVKLLTNEDSAKHVLMKGIISNANENCLVTLVDITDLKIAEAKIKKANEALIKLNAEKDKFFSIIAHDLRSPISSFMELTRFISEEVADLTTADIKRITTSMTTSTRKLYGLLENLLQWSKFHQNLIPFNPKLVQLLPLVNESLETIMESAASKEIVITNTIPRETALWADSVMLQSVIRNLVSNAVKFTPKGGEITLSAKTAEEKNVEISVKDTGIGMNPKMAKNLFQLNQQVNRKGTEGEPSSGLGLILCKEFVEKHGGKIWAESVEGKGSTFFFTIPFKKNI